MGSLQSVIQVLSSIDANVDANAETQRCRTVYNEGQKHQGKSGVVQIRAYRRTQPGRLLYSPPNFLAVQAMGWGVAPPGYADADNIALMIL
jgi:hypothetical protein